MNREPLKDRRPALSFDFEHDGKRYRATVGFDEHDRPLEVFLNFVKYDSELDAFASDAGIMISKFLQSGLPLAELRGMLVTRSNGTAASPLGTVLEHMAKL